MGRKDPVVVVCCLQEVEQLRAAAAATPGPVPHMVSGPTPEQQALMARMAARLEALEAGHR